MHAATTKDEKSARQPDELRTVQVCRLGRVSFPEDMDYEHRLLELRVEEKIGDTLLILEHPPTVTLGKFGQRGNVLLSQEEMAGRGIAFYEADRGGDATFCCPGQLVVHPIVDLRLRGARAYIHDLEEVVLRVLARYGIMADRSAEHPGVWVKDRQISAMGLHFSRGVSMHGLSFNVNPDLATFNVINLCGLPGRAATSIQQELGQRVSTTEVTRRIEEAFAEVFQVKLKRISRAKLRRLCFGPGEYTTVQGTGGNL